MVVTLISNAIRMMAVYIFGATGDIVIEKGGHLNMGVPGIMFFGALGGILGEHIYANNVVGALNPFLVIFVPLIFALIFGALGGLLYCFLTVTLKCNQNVVGLALTTFGVGISKFFIQNMVNAGKGRITEAATMLRYLFFPVNYKFTDAFSEMFLSGSFFTYFAIILAIAVSIFMAKSKFGLNLRAVGENPASADAAGINVTKYKYLSTIIGSAIVGLGGMTYVLDVLAGGFAATNVVDSYGWLALSIVILCAWRSWISIPISFVIGFLAILPFTVGFSEPIKHLISALPYVASIIVLIISSAIGSKKMQPPAGLGKTYFREDR